MWTHVSVSAACGRVPPPVPPRRLSPATAAHRAPRAIAHRVRRARNHGAARCSMPETFGQGMSGCRTFNASGSRRLASEMISMPRSTSQGLRRGLERIEAQTGHLAADKLDSLDDIGKPRNGGRRGHQKTCSAEASMRSRTAGCRLRRVMMSVLRPRIRAAASFTSISSKSPSDPKG